MPGEELLLLLAGGGAAAVAVAKGKAPSTPSQTATTSAGGSQGSGASAPGATVQQLVQHQDTVNVGQATPKPTSWRGKAGILRYGRPRVGSVNVGVTIVPSQNKDVNLGQKIDEVEKYASAVIDKLGDAAKQQGVDALNSEFGFDPPLKASDSFDTISKRVEAMIVQQGAGAIGAAIGGPAGAALGEMVGKFLGKKLADFVNGTVDDIKNWFQSQYSDVENWVKDEAGQLASDVSNAAQDAYNSASNAVSSAADDVANAVSDWF